MKNFRIGVSRTIFSPGAMHSALTALAVAMASLALSTTARAQTCPAYTYSFTNGTTADAPEVNSNFTTIRNCANTLLAPLDGPQFTNHSEFGGTLTQTDADTHSLLFIQPQLSPGASSASQFLGLSVLQTYQTSSAFTAANADTPSAAQFLNFIVNSGAIAENAGASAVGLWVGPDVSTMGTVTQTQAGRFTPVVSFGHALTSTVTRAFGVHIVNSTKGTLTMTGQAGLAIDAISGATNNTALLMGQSTVPSGTFAIYNASTNANYINGNLGIGTSSPAQKLDVNGQVRVGSFASASGTHVCQNSNVLSSCSSSARYKENIRSAAFGLAEIEKLRPVTFKWRGRDEDDFGFIAEDVAKVNPLFATYKDGRVEGVKYDQLTAVLVNAVKVLKSETDRQASISEKLSAALAAERAQTAALRGRLDNLVVRLSKIERATGSRQAQLGSATQYAAN